MSLIDQIDRTKLPEHIAIIMDGNGRWAKKRGMLRNLGHKSGAKTVKQVVEACAEINVKYLTLYAFSTENWNRPKIEVELLMKLLISSLKTVTSQLLIGIWKSIPRCSKSTSKRLFMPSLSKTFPNSFSIIILSPKMLSHQN